MISLNENQWKAVLPSAQNKLFQTKPIHWHTSTSHTVTIFACKMTFILLCINYLCLHLHHSMMFPLHWQQWWWELPVGWNREPCGSSLSNGLPVSHRVSSTKTEERARVRAMRHECEHIQLLAWKAQLEKELQLREDRESSAKQLAEIQLKQILPYISTLPGYLMLASSEPVLQKRL